MAELAPIVMFVYNRVDHTKRLFDSLIANEQAKDSILIIVSDGPKDNSIEEVRRVRELIHKLSGFKEIQIIERENNWGIEKSEFEAVSSVLEKYGKAIILEDDLIVNSHFLKYMNDALTKYENEKRVYSVTGYSYVSLDNSFSDVFFSKLPSSWGWGTWKDRWDEMQMPLSEDDLKYVFTDRKMQRKLDVDGAYPWFQMLAVIYHNIHEVTWDLCWHFAIQKNDGLILQPREPICINGGFDGSGVHCSDHDRGDILSLKEIDYSSFPGIIELDEKACRATRNIMRSKRGFVRLLKEQYFHLIKKYKYCKL